jgi:deoxyribonuclease-1
MGGDMCIHALQSVRSCFQHIAIPFTLTLFTPVLSAQETNPETIIDRDFWGKQYSEGGVTFYCNEKFQGQSPLVSESYIYSESAIRSALECGSKRSCLKNSEEYRQITSDLHNIVPANAFFELKLKGTVFGALDQTESETICGMRRRMHIIEPPDDVKGDIARVIFYMHETYALPIQGSRQELEAWARQDPVSTAEIERHERIREIQGNSDPMWSPTRETARAPRKNEEALN